ncbi:DUF4038 domain-containing protein [candidate division KSB1 bacterium]|nr:DUF4038 domain-containing protein [candidate division KSB1 bacterium]RQW01896.1 MAG: DUF4038 domain-containing protein [candidate division KSB1 bacterium]
MSGGVDRKMRMIVMAMLFLFSGLSQSAEWNLEIDDPLTTGSTVGRQGGGIYTEKGWKTETRWDHIQYDIETCSHGKIEFDVQGLYASNQVFPNELYYQGQLISNEDMHYTLFNMWDRDESDEWYGKTINGIRQWHNPWKLLLHIFGYVEGDQWKWQHGRFRLNVSAYQGGYDDDPHAFELEYGPITWQKEHIYHVRLEWGHGQMSYYIDDQLYQHVDYSSFGTEYAPPYHSMRLGSAESGCKGMEMQVPQQITYANFKFFRQSESSAPFVQDFTPGDNAVERPFTASFSTGSADQRQVEKFGIFELAIVAPGISGNKYVDVSLRGVFQGPTQRIEINGFWNGGDVYQVRMMPTEVGTWSYSLSGSHSAFDKSGSFTVTESNRKGHIHVNPDNPYTFIWDDGTPWMWKGETSWRLFTHLYPYESRFKEYIDLRHEQGFNVVQAIVVSYINGDAFWANEGGVAFQLTQSGKDYDRLNPGYFQWLDRRIEYMNSLGMAPVIFFTWAQEFVKFSEAQFAAFCDYMVARFSAYNVFWCLSGEHSEVYDDFGLLPSVWRQHGRHVAATDPYAHPITLHPGGKVRSSAEFGADEWFGFVMQQTPDFHAMIARDRIYSKPVVNGEYAYAGWTEDDNSLRTGAWEIFTAGGYATAGFFTTFAPDKGGYDLNANAQQQQEMMVFHEFTQRLQWWSMQPNDALVSTGHCIADPGREYVVYSRNGGSVELNLAAVNGEIDMQWFNPRTGDYSPVSRVTGGATLSLAPPFSGDWVLYVGGSHDARPPAAPSGLMVISDQ